MSSQAQAVLDAFIGDLRVGERVRHIHTRRCGIIRHFTMDSTRAAIQWRRYTRRCDLKYVNISLLKRI